MSERDDQNIPSGLKALRGLKVEPSPFLAKRIEANWKASLPQETSLAASKMKWRERLMWALAPLAVAAIALHLATRPSMSGPNPGTAEGATYALNQPYMIRMDVRELPREEVAYAEIDLGGESVHFASKHVEVASAHTIKIPGDRLLDKQYLPIVVEGSKAGAATVTANFYSASHQLLASKTLTLVFKGAAI